MLDCLFMLDLVVCMYDKFISIDNCDEINTTIKTKITNVTIATPQLNVRHTHFT